MHSPDDHVKLKEIYESIALSKDERTTACDFNLRELEIETALESIKDGHDVLDVGCGLGYALRHYAKQRRIKGCGVDYAENMIEQCHVLEREDTGPFLGTVEFRQASVVDLPFRGDSFDVVTSSRCLMALLDWERQKQALVEICAHWLESARTRRNLRALVGICAHSWKSARTRRNLRASVGICAHSSESARTRRNLRACTTSI